MSFLNPLFLIALISVGIPLLIYLLNLRKPRKVLFSTLAFFDILKSTSLKRIKIKRWLLLAVRCAAIIMLVLAASRPFLPPLMGFEGGDNEPKSIGILVDNSPSMQQTDAGGPYFSQAISTAAAITSLARNGDRLYLEVTNGESMNSPGQTANTVKASLSDLEIKNAGNYTLQRLKNLAVRLADSPEPVNIIYLITDSQASQFAGFDEINEKFESVSVQVFKVGSGAQNNVAVISTDMVSGRAGGDSEIHIETTVQNFSNTEIRNYFLSLEVDGELISQKIVNMDPGSTVQYKFEFIPHSDDLTKAKIVLEGDEYTFDNTRYVAIQSPETKNILVLQDDNRQRSFQSYLKPLLDAAVGGNGNLRVRYSALNTSIIGELNDFDTIVLDGLQEIPEYVVQELVQLIQQGNGMLFLPSATGDIANYNRFLQFAGADRFDNVIGSYGSFQAVDRLSVLTEGHPVLDEMFDKPEDEQLRINAPEIFYYYKQENSRASTNRFEIARTQTGESLLTEYKVGNGILIVSGIGSDPGWSNFPVKPLFAPLLYRTVLYLTAVESQNLKEHLLGDPFQIQLPKNPDQIRLIYDGTEILPDRQQVYRGTQITYHAENWEPGWAEVRADGKKILYAINQNAMESDFKTLNEKELKEKLETLFPNLLIDQMEGDVEAAENQIQSASFGREIWYWFIIIAIVLLLLESVVSRSYKAETIQ